jgi:hypothetical protein
MAEEPVVQEGGNMKNSVKKKSQKQAPKQASKKKEEHPKKGVVQTKSSNPFSNLTLDSDDEEDA